MTTFNQTEYKTGSVNPVSYYDYVQANETVNVLSGVLIGSDNGYGLNSDKSGSVLNNSGNILSGGGTPYNVGVRFGGDNGTIHNFGNITGGVGVLANGSHASIDTSGIIEGLNADGIWSAGDQFTLHNAGMIYGQRSGVHMESPSDGGAISNDGTIKSSGYGVWVDTKAGSVTQILNNLPASISGTGGAAIYSEGGAFSLTNLGQILGSIVSAADQNDFVRNTGFISGTVLLGKGNDTFNGKGGTSGEVFGGSGNDHLIGGKKGDLLHGNLGNDTLTGGAGKDAFIFDTAPDAPANVDVITDFTHAFDKIELSHADFGLLSGPGAVLAAGMFHVGAKAHDANDHIMYNPNNGWLIYDSNGMAAGGASHFATLTPHLTLTNTDFLVIP